MVFKISLVNLLGQKSYLEFDDYRIPIYVYIEYRSSIRYSITKKGLHIRIPKLIPGISSAMEIEKAEIWIRRVIIRKPEVAKQFQVLNYPNSFEIKTTHKSYNVSILQSVRKSIGGKVIGNEIVIKLPNNQNRDYSHQKIPSVLSKIIAADQIEWITNIVFDINNQHFNKQIKKVSLKYNKTNWGSCSSKLNINLSTRLLFAPLEVINYVIIHELSHLEVMNHSTHFWEIVKKAMPDYKSKEQWLKENVGMCDFVL
jgi:predicted metal-dependent hydrolase